LALQAKHQHRSMVQKLDYYTRRFPADTPYITLHSIGVGLYSAARTGER